MIVHRALSVLHSLLSQAIEVRGNGDNVNVNAYVFLFFFYASVFPQKEYRPVRKEAGRLLFDFDLIVQVLSSQPTMIINNRFRRSQLVSSRQHLRCDDRRALLTTTVI